MNVEGYGVLPRAIDHVRVPPIKCQGIKTRLVPLILSSIRWDGRGRWIEPFAGSGAVLLNAAPPRAHAADTNIHIIRFYQELASGAITPTAVRAHLECEGARLRVGGAEYYDEARARFNAVPASLDFLFLNRSCFNGVMRFNRRGEFNVPFGRKPDRFRPAYVTKIVNQVAHAARVMDDRDWTFETADWRKTLDGARLGDFVYADPPYQGRHTDYFNAWSAADARELRERLMQLPCGFALSTWQENAFRRNPELDSVPPGCTVRTFAHFYHVGPSEANRHPMMEALVIRDGFAAG